MTTYYLDPLGSDQATGTDPLHPIQTLGRLHQIGLKDGDHIKLKGGETFEGGFVCDRPVDISSYGDGRATVTALSGAAMTIRSGGVHVSNLYFRGDAVGKAKEHFGIKLIADAAGQRFRDVTLEDLLITGFGGNAIDVGSTHETRPGFDHLRIRRVTLTGNFGTGVATWDDAGDRAAGYAHHDVLIEDCQAVGNFGGSGFVVAGVEGGAVVRCVVKDTHGETGGVGLWSWMSKGVSIKHCIVSGTRSDGGDGGGFDLDGGCVDCSVEECLAFDNDGPGFMHCDYPLAPRTASNACRCTVSINDGRKKKGEPAGFGFVTWGSGLDDCIIEHCLAVVEPDSLVPEPQGVLFAAYILGSQGATDHPHITNCVFRQNTVHLLGKGHALVSSTLPVTTPAEVTFLDNVFHLGGGIDPVVRCSAGGTVVESFSHWQSATAQTPQTLLSSATPISGYRAISPEQLPQWLSQTLKDKS